MMIPEPVSDCEELPNWLRTCPVTWTVTMLGPITAAADSGVPFTVSLGLPTTRVPLTVVPVPAVTEALGESSRAVATAPPAPPPTTRASASSSGVPLPFLRGAAGAGGCGGATGGGSWGRTAVAPGCDHQGVSGF